MRLWPDLQLLTCSRCTSPEEAIGGVWGKWALHAGPVGSARTPPFPQQGGIHPAGTLPGQEGRSQAPGGGIWLKQGGARRLRQQTQQQLSHPTPGAPGWGGGSAGAGRGLCSRAAEQVKAEGSSLRSPHMRTSGQHHLEGPNGGRGAGSTRPTAPGCGWLSPLLPLWTDTPPRLPLQPLRFGSASLSAACAASPPPARAHLWVCGRLLQGWAFCTPNLRVLLAQPQPAWEPPAPC